MISDIDGLPARPSREADSDEEYERRRAEDDARVAALYDIDKAAKRAEKALGVENDPAGRASNVLQFAKR